MRGNRTKKIQHIKSVHLMADSMYRLRLKKGDDYRKEFHLKDSAGEAIDLTGCSFKMQIRESFSSDVLLELSTENEKIELDAENGVIALVFIHADTSAANWKKAIYDIELKNSADEIQTIVSGTVDLYDEVTK